MKTALATAIAATLALGAVVMPSQAAEPVPSLTYRPAAAGATPALACRASEGVFILELRLDGVVVDEVPLAEPGQMTVGACVSTIVNQQLSTAGYVANCTVLEPMFASQNLDGRPYPYSFYGNPDYTAQNRADCIALLRSFHTAILG
jgi:hypothetical protein